MRVKIAVNYRFRALAAAAGGLACALALSGCSSLRSQPTAPANASPEAVAADASRSAAAANAGAQTTTVTKLQKFLWIFTPYRPDIQQGNFVSQEMLEQLKPGMTRDQVKFVLGTPLLTDMFHADRWDYPFYLARGNGELTTSRVTVFFKDNKVDHFDGGHLPTEKEYIARIAGTVAAPPPDERKSLEDVRQRKEGK
ncbi:outer membrane protein assembly factor BamE [Massilia agilis]|uniref:Outer membrane protein assembly factor BamE n=2 Tax=Massilia TaxID=149698 RepID=A0ABT2BMW1_9BURK|nr:MULTISPECIES: outer membrane protein assembly factor BamE [Massilia]MCS0609213.1 outer membrane protein assembly factor BamE [Massilia solisilvae]MCS0810637.1 outer membrane protein assembly factor BamE [Massilia agilis]